jgi:hypothetical protein
MERLQQVIQNGGEYVITWYKFGLEIFGIDEMRPGVSLPCSCTLSSILTLLEILNGMIGVGMSNLKSFAYYAISMSSEDSSTHCAVRPVMLRFIGVLA